jgi:hypothetical protein
MQSLIEVEAADQIGAEPHEGTVARATHRNGYRARTLDPGGGRLELQVPALCQRGFERYVGRRRLGRGIDRGTGDRWDAGPTATGSSPIARSHRTDSHGVAQLGARVCL